MINFNILRRKEIFNINFNVLTYSNRSYKGFVLSKNKLKNINFPKLIKPTGINIFYQLYPNEPQHSKILGELLNPYGQHNCGNIFLESFFNNVIKEYPFNKKEKWIITVEKENYDIRIRNLDKSAIIIIENKSNGARDQPNQLFRYWYNGIYSIQKNLINIKYSKIIYISPHYNKHPDEQTKLAPNELRDLKIIMPDDIIKIVYFSDEIYKWLDDCLNIMDNESDMYYYIKQYKHFWRYYYDV
jgi:hypothetical protein